MVNVELVYVPLNQRAIHQHIIVTVGATVADVLNQSGMLLQYPEIEQLPLGVFSKPVTRDTVIKTGDRIEIYRPLLIDPKENRRKRAVSPVS